MASGGMNEDRSWGSRAVTLNFNLSGMRIGPNDTGSPQGRSNARPHGRHYGGSQHRVHPRRDSIGSTDSSDDDAARRDRLRSRLLDDYPGRSEVRVPRNPTILRRPGFTANAVIASGSGAAPVANPFSAETAPPPYSSATRVEPAATTNPDAQVTVLNPTRVSSTASIHAGPVSRPAPSLANLNTARRPSTSSDAGRATNRQGSVIGGGPGRPALTPSGPRGGSLSGSAVNSAPVSPRTRPARPSMSGMPAVSVLRNMFREPNIGTTSISRSPSITARRNSNAGTAALEGGVDSRRHSTVVPRRGGPVFHSLMRPIQP